MNGWINGWMGGWDGCMEKRAERRMDGCILFIQTISITSSRFTTTQRRSRHSTDIVSEFQAGERQVTVSEGLAQGPYLAARTGFEPPKGDESTNELPRPIHNTKSCTKMRKGM